MCRLYTFRSSHRRKIECELIAAQNSLLRQSTGDAEGLVHPDGWGLGHYADLAPFLTRQPVAAVNSEQFRWAAAEAFTTNALAHVRSATIGIRRAENTHPFQVDRWLFAHNGTVGAFPLIRDRVLAAMQPAFRDLPRGDTDSEHVFHLALSELARRPERGIVHAVRTVVNAVTAWSRSADSAAELALNMVVTDGAESVVSRCGRSLWYVEREEVHACQVCAGALHVEGTPPSNYRAVVFASEPITTDEPWTPVREGVLQRIGPTLELSEESL